MNIAMWKLICDISWFLRYNSNIFPGYPCFEKNIQTKADYLQNTVIKPIEIKEGYKGASVMNLHTCLNLNKKHYI